MGNVIKNGWWFLEIKFVLCTRQYEEDVGSAGEQPARNKIDAYTKKEGWTFGSALTFLVSLCLKKLISYWIDRCTI